MHKTATKSVSLLQSLIQEKVDLFLSENPTLTRRESAFFCKIYVRDKGIFHNATVQVWLFYKQGAPALYIDSSATRSGPAGASVDPVSELTSAFADAAARLSGTEPILPSINVQVFDRVIARDEEIYKVAHQIWCELFGLDPVLHPVPNDFDIEKYMKEELAKLLFPCLAHGEKGVKIWNSCPDEQLKMLSLSKLDAREKILPRIRLVQLNLKEANFSNAVLQGANLYGSDISKSKFVRADLQGAGLFESKADGADFSEAKMQRVRLEKAKLKKALFCGADLQNADLKGADFRGGDLSCANPSNAWIMSADLRGTNLTGCNCTGAHFDKAKYDQHTKFPENFSHWREMQWKGEGQNPFIKSLKEQASTTAPVDFSGMLDSLRQNLDKARIDKAISMLKKETFQLYFEAKDDSINGIVKSQTDAELVYACQLSSEGKFACCTQNLNVCGGLRGALCKHILVLLIGLVKTDHIDATRANRWMLASKLEQPALDRELMTELFLRYKGAESGEIDWRPAETIPEDYYAF